MLQLHEDVYPLDAIERAASAFSGSARFQVRAGSPHHSVSIEAQGAPGQLASEFANYVLATVLVGAPAEERD